jgi:hypothetical protein
MMPFQLDQVKQGAVGNDAGWALAFHRETATGIAPDAVLEISSSDYYASIDATLQEGMAPGGYRIVVEQLIDDHVGLLRTGEGDRPLVCKLYLFWRDANTSVGAYFTNLLGVNAGPSAADLHQSLVAVLRVKKMSRRTGDRGYDTELVCAEEAYARLSQPVGEQLEAANFGAAITAIRERTHVEFAVHDANPDGTMTRAVGEAAGDEHVTFGKGLRYTAAVERLANGIEQGRNLYGRKMVLIRDGTVHIGKRPIPYPEGPPKDLTLETGLLESVESGEEVTDPYADAESASSQPAKRVVWTLTLKGRPDLKPGDVVRFEPPPEPKKTLPSVGEALLGAFAAPFLPSLGAFTANAKLLYVRSVRHTHSRAAGFATVVTGVVIKNAEDAWDKWSDATPDSMPAPSGGSASPGVAVVEAVRRVVRASRVESRSMEVGEVRAAATNASGAVEPPAQTTTVWEGLTRPDGRPNGSRRLPIRREEPSPLAGVPYLTPFAWGGCGLILPRYPGTRVALGYRNGFADDVVDLGALWPSGHAPVSQPGDYWLMLPVGVNSGKRSSIPDSDVPADHGGKVVHDLTDGDGNRVIELGELTVRVGRSQLQGRNHRPSRAGDDSITIEHKAHDSKIVLKSDGTILIKGSKIELDAGSTGSITLNAKTVDVHVGEGMEVH